VYAFPFGQPEDHQVAVLFNDITERKQGEEELRRLNESLEAEVSRRTQTAERRARHLRELAAQLSDAEHRERVRLAGLLHDDLQQLLLAIKMRLPVLATAPGSELRERIGEIEELVQASLRSSSDLTRELSPPILQCGTLAESMEWLGDWFREQHGLTVSVKAAKAPPAPEPLRVFLFQALRELFLNVVKHSGEMAARVVMSSRSGYLTIQVEDDGDGFDPDAVQIRLQRPTGFGLFNIQQRLEALGGRLEIRNSPSGGACFRMIVPLAKADESRAEDAEPPVTETTPARATERRPTDTDIRMLIVDDHHIVREGFAAMFDRQTGFHVVGQAADGREAVRQAEELRPDVIVMDVDMPYMNGVEATRLIKRRWPNTVIIGLSLHDDESVGRAMLDAGAAAHVRKSAQAANLIETVRQACRWEPTSQDSTGA
jgi:CheY-like chemotaxis protein